MTTEKPAPRDSIVAQSKTHRRDLDEVLQRLKRDSVQNFAGERKEDHVVHPSRPRSVAITKIQEAIMWLGMDLKEVNEKFPGAAPEPYPESKNPDSPKVEQTADGLKL